MGLITESVKPFFTLLGLHEEHLQPHENEKNIHLKLTSEKARLHLFDITMSEVWTNHCGRNIVPGLLR